jgi:hypothetical protein
MIRLVVLVGLLWGGCALLIGGIQQAAVQRSDATAISFLLPSLACKAPCWQGLRPGAATPEEVRALAEEQGGQALEDKDSREAWVFAEAPLLFLYFDLAHSRITLTPTTLRLGEVIAILGVPDAQQVLFEVDARRLSQQRQVELYYQAEQVIFRVTLAADERLTPQLPIRQIVYARFAPAYYAQPWQGFVFLDPASRWMNR